MPSIEWRVAGASVAGFSHQEEEIPCQDAHAILTTPSGWLIAVVSDGAGSAPRSGEGSRSFCDEVTSHLRARLEEAQINVSTQMDEVTLRLWVESAIEKVREDLFLLASANDGSLRDFHATLVGVVAGAKSGMLFHIGDGAGCATNLRNMSNSILSEPENGEYANETYFATQEDWRAHLRVTPFGPDYDLIALMSDGVTPFALASGGSAPFPPFFEPLSEYLVNHNRDEREIAIKTILERDDIRRITGDDKTLVWAHRAEATD